MQPRYKSGEKGADQYESALKEAVGFDPLDRRLFTSLTNLVRVYSALGRHAEAEPHLKRGLAIVERVLGPEHPNLAQEQSP